ncbi:MAG TPA: hypothetical protein VFR87_15695 [Nocardioidaceae bacterium]|nr:hypothetical protein [Nocardioidaceae bacterium]
MNRRLSSHPAARIARPATQTTADTRVSRQRGHTDGRPLSPAYFGALAVMVLVATVYGLVVEDAYRLVSEMTQETWRAQDAVSLSLVPVILWSSRRARARSLTAHLLTTGIALWWAYCYAHLSIGAPLNPLFLVYLAILLLAGFATLDGLLRLDVRAVEPAFTRAPLRAAAWFLALGGIGIGALWLSEIIAAWPGGLPSNIHLSELPNPTWVLDLAWIIPMCLAAVVLMRRHHPAGPVLAAVMLLALLILSVSMLLVTPFAVAEGLHTDPEIRTQIVVFTVVFTALGAVELWLLIRGRRRLGSVTSAWLRDGWWPDG